MFAKNIKKLLGWILALVLVCGPLMQPAVYAQEPGGGVTPNGVFAAPTSTDWVPGLVPVGYRFGSGAHSGQFTLEFDLNLLTGTPTGNVGFGAYVDSLVNRPVDVSFEGRPGDGNFKTLSAGGTRIPYETGDQFHFTYSINTATQKYNVTVTRGGAQVISRSDVGFAFAAANIGGMAVRNHCNGTFAVKNLKIGGTAENLVNAVDDVNNPPSVVRPSGNLFEVGPGRTFRKIQDVLSLLRPGDTVLVYPGTYPGGVVLPALISGTESQPLTIRGIKDAQGKRPVLKAMGANNDVEALAHHLVLEGLDIAGNMDELLAATGTPYSQLQNGTVNNHTDWWNARVTQRGIFQRNNDLVVRDCVIRGTGSGIISSDNEAGSITIEYCNIYDNGTGNGAHNLYLTTAQFLYPDAVAKIRFNYIHDELGSGANIKTRCTRNEIYYNRVENARDLAMELTGPDGDAIKQLGMGYEVEVNSFREDSDVVGNVIIERDGSWGVRMGGDKNMAQTYGRYRFVNNTFLMAGGAPLRVETGTIESLELYNNIFDTTVPQTLLRVRDPDGAYWSAWSNGAEQIAGSRNWISDKYVDSVPTQLQNTIRGSAPGFNDAANGDYSLRQDIALPGVPMNQTRHTWELWTANGGRGYEINGYEQVAYLTDIDTAFPNPLTELYYTPVNRDGVTSCRPDALDTGSTPAIGAYPAMLPAEEVAGGKVVHQINTATPDNGTINIGAAKAGEGEEVGITALPNAGYYFAGWTVSGEGAALSSADSTQGILTMGTDDVTVGASFARSGGMAPEKRYVFDGTLNNIRPFKYWGDFTFPENRYLFKSLDGTVTMRYEGDYWAGYTTQGAKLFQLHHADGTEEDTLTWSRVNGYNGPVPFDEGAGPAQMKFTIHAQGGTDATLFNLSFLHGVNTDGLTEPTLVFNAKAASNLPASTTFMLDGTNKGTGPQFKPVVSESFSTAHGFWMYNNQSSAGITLPDKGVLKAFAWAGDFSGMSMDIAEIYFAGPGTTPLRSALTLTQPTGGTLSITNPSGDGNYAPGEAVNLTAADQPGYTFAGWQTSGGGSFGNALAKTTTFSMPGNGASITAYYVQQGHEPLEKLTVDYSAVNRKYILGSTLNMSGLQIQAKYTGLSAPVQVNPNNCSYYINDGNAMSYTSLNSYVLQGPTGDYRLKVAYTNGETKSVTFTFRVSEPAVLSGIILKTPNKTAYTLNAPLDLTGMEVSGVYSDGTSRVLGSGEYTLKIYLNGNGTGTAIANGALLSQYGMHRIEVASGGKTRSFTITVATSLTGLEITQEPGKRNYGENEHFNTTGLVVTGHFSDGTTRPLAASEYSISPANGAGLTPVPDGQTSANQTVTVTAGTYSDSFSITVYPEMLGIYAAPNRQFNVGDTVTGGDMDVTAIYRNSTFMQLSPGAFSLVPDNFTFTTAGRKALQVTYGDKTAFVIVSAGQEQAGPVITIGAYNTNPTNQDITVTASANKGTLNATSHIFTENGSFSFVATDSEGHVTTRTVTITNIDKMAPVITIGAYSTVPTSQAITVSASTNEGTLNAVSHTFTENGSFDFVAVDAAGNTAVRTVTITNITVTTDKRYIFDGTLNNIRPFRYWGDPYLPETRYFIQSADGTVTMNYSGEYWAGYDAQGIELFHLYHAGGTSETAITWSRVGGYAGPVPFDEGAGKAQLKFTIRATGSGASLFELPCIVGADTAGITEPKIVVNAKVTSSLPPSTTFMLNGTSKGTGTQFRPVASDTFTTAHQFWMYNNQSSTGMSFPDNGTLTAMAWAGDYSGMTIDIAEIYFAPGANP